MLFAKLNSLLFIILIFHTFLLKVVSAQNSYQIHERIENSNNPQWRILKKYEKEYTNQVAMPIGGIGTGVVYLSGRGELKDWSIMNRPGFGYNPSPSFFCLCAKKEGAPPVSRVLEGQIKKQNYTGQQGSPVKLSGLPRFEKHSFETTYPFGRVILTDKNMPVDVDIEAFNPFVPANVENSSIPIAILRFTITNTTNKTVDISISGNLRNFIGNDGLFDKKMKNKNTFFKTGNLQGILFSTEDQHKYAEQYGSMALTTSDTNQVTYRTDWTKSVKWFKTDILDFWDDFSIDGRLEERNSGNDNPIASLVVNRKIPPGKSSIIEFYLTWYFPNRNKWDWNEIDYPSDCDKSHYIGNYYTTKYNDAWDVAEKEIKNLPWLELNTIKFINCITNSDFPETIKEAALFNLANMRSQTMFMDMEGRLFGFEGQVAKSGGWWGNCTHVYNYEQAIPFLYGELSKTMREIEFNYATDPKGKMAFRVKLPLNENSSEGLAAADGQMGCIMKLYRDWQLSGDDQMLNELWPKAKKALEFAWIEGGWDADKDGVMEGCQHNTMDIDYFGPNPQMGIWYLGALRAAEEISIYKKDRKFAEQCRQIYESGSKWIDGNLFNGNFYQQMILPPKSFIANDLMMHDGLYGEKFEYFQLDKGCLVDQLVGQYMAHICGLGYLVNKKNVIKTLNTIYKYNFIELNGHFNNMRSFALNDEKGLVMASYPKGRNKFPFPYFSEVMSGFEYSTAAHLIYEGMPNKAIECISAIRERYDGENRNPFNEFEAGYHYARTMSSWSAILALTEFHYSGVKKSLTIASKEGTYFWSNGYAWGTYNIEKDNITLYVAYGSLNLKEINLSNGKSIKFEKQVTLDSGKELMCKL